MLAGDREPPLEEPDAEVRYTLGGRGDGRTASSGRDDVVQIMCLKLSASGHPGGTEVPALPPAGGRGCRHAGSLTLTLAAAPVSLLERAPSATRRDRLLPPALLPNEPVLSLSKLGRGPLTARLQGSASFPPLPSIFGVRLGLAARSSGPGALSQLCILAPRLPPSVMLVHVALRWGIPAAVMAPILGLGMPLTCAAEYRAL